MTSNKEIFRLKEISEKYNIPHTRLTLAIRQGKIKAVKSGKEYLVSTKEINKYLGLETSDELLQKEFKIKELESKIEKYELKIKSLRNYVEGIQNVILNG